MGDLVYVFAQFSWTNIVLIEWEKSPIFRGRTGGKLTGTEVNDRTLAREDWGSSWHSQDVHVRRTCPMSYM